MARKTKREEAEMRLWLSGPRILHGLVRPAYRSGGRFSPHAQAPAVSGRHACIFKRDTDGAIFLASQIRTAKMNILLT